MFKRSIQLLLFVCLVMGALWAADNPFVGKWKLNPSRSKLTDVMKVASVGANKYAFNLGGGSSETIVADGTDQPGLAGTTLSVTVEGPSTWKVVRRKNGRMLLTATWNLSKDGNTLSDDFTGIETNGSTSNVKYVYKRTAGESGFAGTWESTSEQVNFVYEIEIRTYEEDGLSIIDHTAEVTQNSKFDGKDYPNMGANARPGSASSLRRVNEHALEMTDKTNGKIRDTRRLELSADLKTLTMTVQGAPNIYVFERQ